MRGHWWRLGAALALLVFLLGGVAACGDDDDGGDKDVDKIKSRMESFTNHINKADAKGLINDLPPSIRKDCDEQKIKKGAEELKSLGLKVKDVKNTAVTGDKATADVTIESTMNGQKSEDTSQQKFLREGGQWYIDNEGQSCADFIS